VRGRRWVHSDLRGRGTSLMDGVFAVPACARRGPRRAAQLPLPMLPPWERKRFKRLFRAPLPPPQAPENGARSRDAA